MRSVPPARCPRDRRPPCRHHRQPARGRGEAQDAPAARPSCGARPANRRSASARGSARRGGRSRNAAISSPIDSRPRRRRRAAAASRRRGWNPSGSIPARVNSPVEARGDEPDRRGDDRRGERDEQRLAAIILLHLPGVAPMGPEQRESAMALAHGEGERVRDDEKAATKAAITGEDGQAGDDVADRAPRRATRRRRGVRGEHALGRARRSARTRCATCVIGAAGEHEPDQVGAAPAPVSAAATSS